MSSDLCGFLVFSRVKRSRSWMTEVSSVVEKAMHLPSRIKTVWSITVWSWMSRTLSCGMKLVIIAKQDLLTGYSPLSGTHSLNLSIGT